MNQPIPASAGAIPPPAPEPSGRFWWTATAVLHGLSAVVFAAGCWASIHWLQRVNTDAYYESHRHADPDGMLMLQFVVLGLAIGCAAAVVYAVIGFAVTLGGLGGGPIMLVVGVLAAPPVGLGASSEVPLVTPLAALLCLSAMALLPCGMVVGCVACGRPRRPAPRAAAAPPPYTGGSPYLRPPGS